MKCTFASRFRLRRAAVLLACALSLPATGWAESGHDGYYSASFSNTDIHEFINTVSKNLSKTVIIDPAVKGNISVRSYEELNDQQYYQLFVSVLEVYGFTVVDMQNGVLKVVPEKNSKGSVVPLVGDSHPAAGDEVVMQLVPLHNVTAKELVPLLQQLNDAAVGSVVHYDPSNVLLITGRAAVVDQLIAIVDRVDSAGDRQVETIKLTHASADEVARIITSLHKTEGKSTGRPAATIVADQRTNSVLIGGDQNARQQMIDTVLQMDGEGEVRGNTRVIYLKYAKAQTLVDVLNGVSTTATQPEGRPSSTAGSAAARTAAVSDVSMLKDASIRADEQTNALIVNAAPDVMRDLEQVIEKLDIRRAQVQVEAIIVEVQDADGLNLGVQWFNQHGGGTNFPGSGVGLAGSQGSTLGDLVGGAGEAGLSGLTAGFYRGNWSGLFTALQTSGRSNILATPSIVTLDNMEAEFNVGQEVPVLSGQQTSEESGNLFNSVDRKNVGIKLKVKPQINQGDSVLLEIEQEVSSVAPGNDPALGPTFNTRTVRNAVLVRNNSTVVVGGLLDTSQNDQQSSVPLLGSIPLLGHLFKSSSQEAKKRNLMLFIRPTIIREQEAYNRVSDSGLDKFGQQQGDDATSQQLNRALNEQLALPQNNGALADTQRHLNAFWQG